ncbi:pentapeptide repeat-containing protein [Leptolyngbya sp. DQ-M1]|uniref:pentapeptide repeat-containing protein n=1 Tax=Leptolyngbya sp. DQ-M1 TaxID=2933920 RepID=UPI003299A730
MMKPKSRAAKYGRYNFTKEQIIQRAQELWEQYGQEGTPEDYTVAAFLLLRQEQSLVWKTKQFLRLSFTAKTPGEALDIVKVIISAFGVIATLFAGVGLYLTYQNSQAERQLNTERLVTDRFAKAVEQLGSQDIHVRLGAIYALERIAKDSPKDHGTVMEVLTAYIRNKSPLPEGWRRAKPEERKPLPRVTTDVQSALTVLGRREVQNDRADTRLDLDDTNLSGASFVNANFSSASLIGANLTGVLILGGKVLGTYFVNADLSGAQLHSQFEGADFSGADLQGANLRKGDFTNANFQWADFTAARLYDEYGSANLQGANLTRANLSQADFKKAKNITPEQIKQAKNWNEAYYSDDFSKQLGITPIQPTVFVLPSVQKSPKPQKPKRPATPKKIQPSP